MTTLGSQIALSLVRSFSKKLYHTKNILRRVLARRAFQRSIQEELFSGQSLSFRRLEPRRVLNASSAAIGGDLVLTGLAANTDLQILTSGADYQFVLSAGTWDGGASNTLTFAQASLTSLTASDFGLLTIDAATALTANAVSLTADNVTIDGSVTATNSTLSLDAIGVGGDVQINGQVTANGAGNIVINAVDDVQIGGVGAINAGGNGSVTLDAGGDIIDDTAAETANISTGSGTVSLTAQGSIGDVGDSDIDLAVTNLTFNAAGAVQVTDLSGGLTINGVSTAGGGSITANSPLTISANITVSDSTIFTAGNSGSNVISDNLTIDNGAVVTLNSAANRTLTFNAGDSIAFDTGRIDTTGGGTHNVFLNADIEGAGVLDGFRGAITQDGSASIEVTTNALTATAATGIDLDTSVDSVNASTTATGSILIDEFSGITLTSVTTTDGLISVTAGGLVTATSVNAAGAGSNAILNTSTGGITATSVTAANNVQLSATAGNITSGTVQATAGSVVVTATSGDVTVGSITAGTTVNITATAGSINDAQNDALVDITAGAGQLITLSAQDEIAGAGADGRLELAAGSIVSANSTTAGNIMLRGLGAITLNPVTTTLGTIDVLAAGLITATSVNAAGAGSNAILNTSTGGITATSVTAANNVQLSATAGNITATNVTATAGLVDINAVAGNVSVQLITAGTSATVMASGNITDGDTPGDDTDISAADVFLTAANIGGTSGDIFQGTFNPLEVTATGNLTATAAAGAIAIDATVGGTVTLTSVTAFITSNGNLTAAPAVNVTNLALIADADNNGTGTLTIGPTLTVTGDLRLQGADIVATDGSIDLGAARLMLKSGQGETINVATGVLDATAAGNLIVNASTAINLQDLDADNIALASTTAAGHVILQTTAGSITVTNTVVAGAGIANASGNILLSAVTDVIINANITSGTGLATATGNITVLAGDDIVQNANIATGTGTVYLNAANAIADAISGVDMQSGSQINTATGNVRVVAGNSGDILLARINAGTGNVSLVAERAILDANVAAMNVLASTLRMTGGGTIGQGSNAIETTVAVLAAQSADGIFVLEANAVAVNATGAISVNEVNADGSTTVRTDLTLADLTTTSAGAIVLTNLADSITLIEGGDGDGFAISAATNGNVLVNAIQDVIVNSDIRSATGHVTVIAGDDIDQNANIITGGAGTVYLNAANAGAVDAISGVDMLSGTQIQTSGGNVRVVAGNEGDILLARIDAGTGSVSLIAGRSILDINDAAVNVLASTLGMLAGGTVGASTNAIETAVGTLAAQSADGIFVQEADGIAVNATGALNVNEVNADGSTTVRTDLTLADLTTTSAGAIVLTNLADSITLNEGGDGNGFAISAGNGGNVLVNAIQDVIIDSDIRSATGHVTVIAGDDIDQNANITTGGAGTVYLNATNAGAADAISGVDMLSGTRIQTATGNVRIVAGNEGDILLARINAGTGNVSLIADRSILDSNAESTLAVAATIGQNQLTLASAAGLTVGDEIIVTDNERSELFAVTAITGDVVTLSANLAAAYSTTATVSAVNVRAGTLRMVGDANSNQVGTVGVAANAIETSVTTLASSSADGIFVHEFDSITVNATGNLSVTEVTFTGTLDRTDNSLSDLVTTDAGAITLQSLTGQITLNDGNANGFVVNAGSGNVTLHAAGSIQNDLVLATTAIKNQNMLTLVNANGLQVGDTITLQDNNSPTQTLTINAIAGNTLTLSGNLTNDYEVTQNASLLDTPSVTQVIANQLEITAASAHLSTKVSTLTAIVTSNATLSRSFIENSIANDKGDDFLSSLRTGLDAVKNVGSDTALGNINEFITDNQGQYQYGSRFNEYALFIINSGKLDVTTVTAGDAGTSASPNIYIETLQGGDLNINGIVSSKSNNSTMGGIVLIAGGTLDLNKPNVTLQTSALAVENKIVDLDLNAVFFDGGEGVGNLVSTGTVQAFVGNSADAPLPDSDQLPVGADFFQRVVMTFGASGEAGFQTIIGYADGYGEITQFPGQVGASPNVQGATRDTIFEVEFLNKNTNLPTNAVIRRSDNFFLFSNGGSEDLAVDQTVAVSPIENVFSNGTPGGPMPEEPALPQPAIYFVVPSIVLPTLVTQEPLEPVELPTQVQRAVEVAVYQIDFDGLDSNENGQIEEAELPSFEIVLTDGINADSVKKPIVPKDGGKTPTPGDIERAKIEMQNDPNQPTGAYAIIRTDAEGNQTVLDVFSIRDWREEQQAEEGMKPEDFNVPQFGPFKPKNIATPEGAEVIPPPVAPNNGPQNDDTSLRIHCENNETESRCASAGLLFGSLWMLRTASNRQSESATPQEIVPSDTPSQDYSRQARRSRMLSQ